MRKRKQQKNDENNTHTHTHIYFFALAFFFFFSCKIIDLCKPVFSASFTEQKHYFTDNRTIWVCIVDFRKYIEKGDLGSTKSLPVLSISLSLSCSRLDSSQCLICMGEPSHQWISREQLGKFYQKQHTLRLPTKNSWLNVLYVYFCAKSSK